MGKFLFVLIVFIVSFTQAKASGLARELTTELIVQRAWEEMKIEQQTQNNRAAIAGHFDHKTALANPEVSFGLGTVANSIGLQADYREWGVSQKLSLSGWKDRLDEQKDLALQYSDINSQQQKMRVAEHALNLAYELKVQAEKSMHVKHRLKRLQKLRTYLKARPFPSPQQKVELEFIKAKIAEVSLDVDFITRDLQKSRLALMTFLGVTELPPLNIQWKSAQALTAMYQSLSGRKSTTIQRGENLIQQTEKEKQAESIQWVPDLNIYYSHSEEQYLGGNKNNTFGLSFEFPLFNQRRSIHRGLTAKQTALELQMIEAQRNEKITKDQDYAQLDKCLMVLERYTENYIHEKEKALDTATKNFDRGLITASQYIDLEEKVHSIHSTRLENLHRSHALIAKVLKIWGDEKQLREFL